MRPAVILFALAAFAMASPVAMEAKEDSVAVPSFYQNLDFVDAAKPTEEKKPSLLSKIDKEKTLDQVKIAVAKGCKVVHGLLTECLAPKTAD
ncbi:hypothetical protein AB1N83_014442 [Pleurotus pulmonarius]|nr:hypothetical protein EYR36_005386 [Pleurotus pulmonarius]KAF4590364.1 hypothetical protein EYR38_009663 [Pleurotus pulmonarius]